MLNQCFIVVEKFAVKLRALNISISLEDLYYRQL